MNTPSRRRALIAVLALGVTASAGCSRDPETVAREYVSSGDAYAAKRQFNEAIIEYKNAVKARPNWAEAHARLASAYAESGDPVKAYGEYARAGDLDPSNVDANVRAGTILLVAGEFDAARTRAELALKTDANHAPALILLGNALAGLHDTERALQQIEQAISLDPSYAPAWTALGAVRFLGGDRGDAGAAFHKAVALAPRSADARLALANYQWANGEMAEAERTLKSTLELDPKQPSAHRALALLYLTTRRAPEAEKHFKALADQPGGPLALADYYLGVGRKDAALTILQQLEQQPDKDNVRAARLRLASIAYDDGRAQEAHQILDGLIKAQPRDVEARTAKARMLLADGGSAAEAATHAREAVKVSADAPAAQYTLGLAAMAEGNLDEAEKAFRETLRLSPRAAAAQLQIARLQLARGEAGEAQKTAEEAARLRPGDAEAAVVLARSLRAQGQLQRAERELTSRLAKQAGSVPLHLELGWLALQRGDAPAARAAFDEALRRAPDSFEARNGLIMVSVAERKLDEARTQLDIWLSASPGDGRLRSLSARVHLAGGNEGEAERILRELVSSDPSQYDAYEILGALYARQGRIDQAIEQYEALASRRPAAAGGARTLIGMLRDAKGERDQARSTYEQVLRSDPRAGVAANNLAWIYAEDGRLDEALRLATVAKEELRLRPEAEDTLGWVYLQKGLAWHAISAFERARDRAPSNPVYHYHLGLAYAKQGDHDRARASLQRALKLKGDFNGADDARAQLAALNRPAGSGGR